MTRMVLVVGCGALVSGLLAVSGCRTNKIRQYIDDIDTVYVTTERPGRPHLYMGQSTQQNPLGQAVSNLGSAMVSVQVNDRLGRVSAPRVHKAFVGSFLDELNRGFTWRIEKNVDAPCDAWLDMKITDYGLRSNTAESPVSYFMTANAEMRDCAEERLIWEDSIWHEQSLGGAYGAGLGDIFKGMAHSINLSSLATVSEAQLEQVMVALADNGARQIVDTMIEDAFGSSRRRRARAAEDDAFEPEPAPDDG